MSLGLKNSEIIETGILDSGLLILDSGYWARLNRIWIPNRVVARGYELVTEGVFTVLSKYACIVSF
jgi:hypothetical protein